MRLEDYIRRAMWRVTFRLWLEQSVLGQMTGLPDSAFEVLTRMLARICEDPCDRLHSMPVVESACPGRPARAHDRTR
jgi:hypothetical protein